MITLADLELERELGRGTSCTVWRARQRHPVARTVAVKRPRAGAPPTTIDRLRREARLLAGLDHPHVIRLLAVLDDGGSEVALVLPVAEGGTLADLLATRGRLACDEAVPLVVALAEAVASLHARGIVHRDVAPANVLLTADGAPLLADLGAAVTVDEPLPTPTGTPGYVDPATLAGAPPTPAADVHALAAVAYRLLAGTLPYPGSDDAEVLASAAAGRRVPLAVAAPEVLPALARCVDEALVGDPGRRPADGAAFATALRRVHSSPHPTATHRLASSPLPASLAGRTRDFAPATTTGTLSVAPSLDRPNGERRLVILACAALATLLAEVAVVPADALRPLVTLQAPAAIVGLTGVVALARPQPAGVAPTRRERRSSSSKGFGSTSTRWRATIERTRRASSAEKMKMRGSQSGT